MSNPLGHRLNDWRKEGTLCDLELVPGDGLSPISCHRLVLMASSDFFLSMLSSGMQECLKNRVELRDCRREVLEMLVDYMYTGESPAGVSGDNVLELFSWGIRCNFDGLVGSCKKFLRNTLGCDNAFSVYAFACGHHIKDLREDCLDFMQNNFEELVESNSHEWLDTERSTVEDIISSDYLRVRNEDKILKYLVLWADHNPHHKDILTHIRTNYLSKALLDDYKDLLEELHPSQPKQQFPRRYLAKHFHLLLQSQWDLSKLFVVCVNLQENFERVELFRSPQLPVDTVGESGEDIYQILCCASLNDGMLWCLCRNQYLFKYNHTTAKLQYHKTVRRDVNIIHMAAVEDVLYSIVVSPNGQAKLEMFLPSLFRWRSFIHIDDDANRIISANDAMYILGKRGSLCRVNPAKVMRPESLPSNPEADWDDCEGVTLPSGNLLVHGRDPVEFTTFEYDVRCRRWTLLNRLKTTGVTNYRLFLSDMDVFLVEEVNENSIRLYWWDGSASDWSHIRTLENDYGRFIGSVYRNRCEGT